MSEFTLVADELHGALSRVAHAAATNEARPTLCAVLLERRGDDLRLVAADNYRVARFDIESAFEDDDGWPESLISITDLPAVLAFLKANPDLAVVVKRTEHQLSLVVGEARLEIEPLDGEYPDVDAVIPEDGRFVATFAAAYLAGLAKGVGSKGLVRLHMDDALSPAVFRDPSTSFVEVIMPVKENLTLGDAPVSDAPSDSGFSPRVGKAALEELNRDLDGGD